MLTAELMSQVRHLEVRTRRRVDDVFAGRYRSAFKGQGMEFAEVREYEPGDDTRWIDWNVTARSGRTFVKRFEEERELTVVLAADLSASGVHASAPRSKARVVAETCAVLALAVSMARDRVGLVLFDDQVRLQLPPRKGRRHILRLLRELLSREPSGAGTDLAGACDRLARSPRRKALVFVVSDFWATGYESALLRLASRHEVVAVQVRDEAEVEPPDVGLVRVRDPESGVTRLIDTSSRRVREALRDHASRHEQAVARACAKAGVDRVVIPTHGSIVRELAGLFHARQRRAAR